MLGRLETRWRTLRRTLGRTALTVRLFRQTHSDKSRVGAPGAVDGASAAERGTHHRGLIVVQIDGLSHAELERALEAGEVPFLARLIGRERYRLHTLYSGLPSSTPAVQGELFYGVRGAVPAFAWRSRASGELHRMYDPASARAVERVLAGQGEPLLAGGSAYCDIYTGGAAEAHFCVASLGWSDVLEGARPHAWAAVALLHLPTILRTGALVALEFARATGDAVRGIAWGHGVAREATFVLARVAIVVLLRDLITIGAKVDIARGLPVVHLNFIGYDEQAHRRGPDTRFAHRALAGIDRRIGALWKAAHLAEHRHYDLWVYGDHGQARTRSYQALTGRTPDEALAAALQALGDGGPEGAVEREPTPARATVAPSRARLLGGRHLSKLFPDTRPASRASPVGRQASIVGMGPVAHVLLGGDGQPDERTRERFARWFAGVGEVPAVLFVTAERSVRACVGEALLALPADGARLLGADHPVLAEALDDLVALALHADAGDLVLLGWSKGRTALSFADENGAHAGAAPAETLSFALLPEDALAAPERAAAALRPLTLRRAAFAALGRCAAGTASASGADAVGAHRPGSPGSRSCRIEGEGEGEGDALEGEGGDKGEGNALGGEGEGERSLRVMSYNVHGCVGVDGRLAPERIARVIARHAPDVIALQELDVGRTRSGHTDQAATIATMLEMEHRFHPAMRVEEGAYGNAILTHLPVLAHHEGLLPGPRAGRFVEPRGALWITLGLDGCELQVLNTHLGLAPGERRVQVAELLSARWLAHPDCTGPTILCGDLNATPRSGPLLRLGETLLDARAARPEAGRRATFPTRRPTFAIDHVLTREVAGIDRVVVPRTEIERLASDHFPLVVDLRVPVARPSERGVLTAESARRTRAD